MKTRIITGLLLTAWVAVMLVSPQIVMGVFAVVSVGLMVWEEFHALAVAGHRPVTWPTWAGLGVCLMLGVLGGINAYYTIAIVSVACLLTTICVLFRKEPKLVDLSMSVLPVLTVMLPGLCLIWLSMEPVKAVQVVMMLLTLAVPLMGDTCALFGGKAIGGRKLCPAVSPNKTIAGSICSLLGSMVAALLIMGFSNLFCAPETRALLPKWYQYLYLAVAGNLVSQVGDLFASLVKRHSGIKDFSNMFPGHGGMLDRCDGILFMSVLVYCFRLFTK